MREFVFIPVGSHELAAISGELQLTDRAAYRVTAELLAMLEYTLDELEDAEYAAMVLASVAALARFGQRLVLVADVPASLVSPGSDVDNGECRVSGVPQTSIVAYYREAPEVDSAAAAQAASGRTIDDAWDAPEVQELLAEDLLWNDVTEYKGA
ncbi:MAG: DUF6912 family protein [Arachnia sp.]